ncbi:MAG: arginine--tRNA ligase [Clostridia bacterium]|nr:arginine--tRNA ligase [Clostridia bacterium]
MSKIVQQIKTNIQNEIHNTFNRLFENSLLPSNNIPNFNIETPADPKHGDYSSNVAMVCAKVFKTAPVKIADLLVRNFDFPNGMFEKIEVVAPGFINFFFGKDIFSDVLLDIINLKENYGKSNFGQAKKINLEFVSANPTGPMHMGNARGGALGDCLASVLQTAGFDVCREFYINDAGNQIDKFAKSLDIRYLQIFLKDKAPALTEDCYQGEDILDLAKAYAEIHSDKLLLLPESERQKQLVEFALPKNISRMQKDLEKYKIFYDVWFKESDLHNSGAVKEVVDILKAKNLTYEKDGAVWYKATALGFEKDEVLIRKNSTMTYFTADIAYHINKIRDRKFDKCINIWGADHHGHVARLKGAIDAVGLQGDKLDVILMQLVRLVKDGQTVKMSKRTGKAIQLADLLDEVPIDSARFFFNMREAATQMDFDLDLALKQDSQNPVYYVQYAHARIKSIERKIKEEFNDSLTASKSDLYLLDSKEERELIKHLASYTDEIIASAKSYDPTKITKYVITLATLFHKFYNAHRVKNSNQSLMRARLLLCSCTAIVLKNVLNMFNISAPDEM